MRHHDGTEYIRADVVDELAQAAEAMRDWIDAVPDDLPLPTMPGIDRDIIDELIARHRVALARYRGGVTSA